jgi:hypothetical protein
MDDKELKTRVRWNSSQIMQGLRTYPAKLSRDRDIPISKIIQWLRPGQGMTLKGLAELADVLGVDPWYLLEPLPDVLPPLVDGRRRKTVKKSSNGGV